jgi:hypothetical protein
VLQGVCSLILQLDSNILRVARTTDQAVEVVRKRGDSNMDDSISSLDPVRFHVKDLFEGYEYELTDHGLFRRLTFQPADAVLTVDVGIGADIPSLAEDITNIVGNQEIHDSGSSHVEEVLPVTVTHNLKA